MSWSVEWDPNEPPPDMMVDLGGGMVVPLSELAESAEEQLTAGGAALTRGSQP